MILSQFLKIALGNHKNYDVIIRMDKGSTYLDFQYHSKSMIDKTKNWKTLVFSQWSDFHLR